MERYQFVLQAIDADGKVRNVATVPLRKRGVRLPQPVMHTMPRKVGGKEVQHTYEAKFTGGFSSGKIGWESERLTIPADTMVPGYAVQVLGTYLLVDTPPIAVPKGKDDAAATAEPGAVDIADW